MIKKKLKFFLIVGGMTVVVDLMVYKGLVVVGLSVINAKATGFLVGTFFAYVVNRFWTFGNRSQRTGSWISFSALYAFTLFINTYINDCMLDLTTDFDYSASIAFLVATGASATLNFLGINYFIFKAKRYRS